MVRFCALTVPSTLTRVPGGGYVDFAYPTHMDIVGELVATARSESNLSTSVLSYGRYRPSINCESAYHSLGRSCTEGSIPLAADAGCGCVKIFDRGSWLRATKREAQETRAMSANIYTPLDLCGGRLRWWQSRSGFTVTSVPSPSCSTWCRSQKKKAGRGVYDIAMGSIW